MTAPYREHPAQLSAYVASILNAYYERAAEMKEEFDAEYAIMKKEMENEKKPHCLYCSVLKTDASA